jgi:hypothetical protein
MEFKNAIIDILTGQITLIDLSDVEIKQFKEFRKMQLEKDKIEKAEAEAKAAQKAALLERLGITEDEARLLLA